MQAIWILLFILQSLMYDLPLSSLCTPYSLWVTTVVSEKQLLRKQNPCSENNRTWALLDAFPAQKLGLNGRYFRIVTLEVMHNYCIMCAACIVFF